MSTLVLRTPIPGLRLSPALAVAALLLLLLAVDLTSVVLWTRDIPLAEDWQMVPPLTGHEPDLLAWLWSQNNEHRLPLPRLVYWLLLEATHDFRSGMVLSQLALAVLAATLARAAWHARGGQSRYADLLFPLALLHLGHWSNLLWSWQLQFVASVVLAGLVLAAVIAAPGLLAGRRAVLTAVAVMLLPVSGANGLVVGVPMALWLGWQAWHHWRGEEERASRRTGAMLAAAALVALLLVAVYFIGYERPSWSPPAPTARQFVAMLLKYLAYAFGPGVRWAWLPAMVAAVLIFAATAALIARAVVRCSAQERHRATGLAAFASACGGLALAIAWGRGADETPMPDRYALLSAVSLATAGCAWLLYGEGRLRTLVPAAMVVLLAVCLPANLMAAKHWRDWYVRGMTAVEGDIAAGVPVAELAQRHREFLMHWSEQRLQQGMVMLHDAGIGPFTAARRD